MSTIEDALRALKGHKRGLIKVFEPESNNGVAYIFLHGFISKSIQTWDKNGIGRKKSFWPCDLGEKHGTTVFVFDYQNGWFERSSRASMDFDHVADAFITDLYEQCSGFSELVFVTHSFGGLLFKNVFTRLGGADPGPRSMKPKIRALCSFSCPNEGSPWAILSRIPLIATSNFKTLKRNSKRLRALDQEFSAAVRADDANGFRILTFSEHGYVYAAFRVEPSTCKFPYLSDISTDVDSPLNHFDICKGVMDDEERSQPLSDFMHSLNLGSREDAPVGRI